MKILQIGKFYPIRGGVEKVMYDLMLGLSERGIRCDMLCASTEDYPAGTQALNPYAQLIVVPTVRKMAATMLAPAMLSKLRAIAADYDIVHIHHPDPMACLALFLSGYKGRVVLHWHSDILKQKALLKLYKPLQDWMIRRADCIVGTTPVYVKESPFLAKVQQKIDFIPIGVLPVRADIQQIQAIRERFNGKKLIFSLGRLVEYKGYEYLVRAAQYIDQDCKVLIGGTGPLREELQGLIAQLGLEDKVELIGFVEDKDLPAYFQACDVFCLTSVMKTEAFAIVQIEAMSCAKPVLSTRIPGSGVSWVNQDGVSGLTVPCADAEAVAGALQRLLGDEQLYRQLAEGAKARFDGYFTRDSMIDQALRVYEKVLGK